MNGPADSTPTGPSPDTDAENPQGEPTAGGPADSTPTGPDSNTDAEDNEQVEACVLADAERELEAIMALVERLADLSPVAGLRTLAAVCALRGHYDLAMSALSKAQALEHRPHNLESALSAVQERVRGAFDDWDGPADGAPAGPRTEADAEDQKWESTCGDCEYWPAGHFGYVRCGRSNLTRSSLPVVGCEHYAPAAGRPTRHSGPADGVPDGPCSDVDAEDPKGSRLQDSRDQKNASSTRPRISCGSGRLYGTHGPKVDGLADGATRLYGTHGPKAKVEDDVTCADCDHWAVPKRDRQGLSGKCRKEIMTRADATAKFCPHFDHANREKRETSNQ